MSNKTDELIKRFVAKHGDRYDYSQVNYVNANTKIKIICKEHGEFYQIPRKHYAGANCPICAHVSANDGRRTTLEQFIARARAAHGDIFDYSLVRLRNIRQKVTIICPIHGQFNQLAISHVRGFGCSQCQRHGKRTKIERVYDTAWFIERSRVVHGDKYDYSLSQYTKSSSAVTIICKVHGQFQQCAREHLVGNGCQQCSYEKMSADNSRSVEEFIKIATAIHSGKYNYELVKYRNQDTNVVIVCPKHGSFKQKPRHHLRGQGCQICHISTGQMAIYRWLESLHIDADLNDRTLLDGFEVDIAIPTKRVGIEFHGLYWHSFGHRVSRAQIYRHHHKADIAHALGWNLLQVLESEWGQKRSIVESIILSKLGLSRRVNARALTVTRLGNSDVREFYRASHIQGHRDASIHIALVSGDQVYCCMSFSRHNKYQYELIRFASKIATSVRGGASRCFKHFVRTFDPVSLLTYADRRYSNWGLYRTLGFRQVAITKPNYYYVLGSNIHARQRFQKNKLHRRLSSFNPSQSESDNMLANGYRRFWDAGHFKFVWDKSCLNM